MADDAQIIAIEHRFWYKKNHLPHIYITAMQDEDSLEWKFADMKYKAFRIHPSILMEHTVDDG